MNSPFSCTRSQDSPQSSTRYFNPNFVRLGNTSSRPTNSPSPSLFVPVNTSATSSSSTKSHARAPFERVILAIEVIDLTSDNEDDEPKTKSIPLKTPQTHSLNITTLDLNPKLDKESVKHATPSPARSHSSKSSMVTTKSNPEDPNPICPQDSSARPRQEEDRHDNMSVDLLQELNRLPQINKEWAAQFRQRLKNRNRSPSGQTARRSLQKSKARKIKRPITKVKISSKGRGDLAKSMVHSRRDMYEEFEDDRQSQSTKWHSASQTNTLVDDKCLPKTGFCTEITIEDVRDFDNQDENFEKEFAETFDQVLVGARSEAETKMFEIPSWMTNSKRERPTFLKPLSGIVHIALGPNLFHIYWDFLDYHCPILARVCRRATRPDQPMIPRILQNVDLNVFGLFVQWIYTQSLLNKQDEPAYQHRLIGLWVLAKKLGMPRLQNNAIDMLERRRRWENSVQIKSLDYAYQNTSVGDGLRRYLVDTYLPTMHTFSPEVISAMFPKEFLNEITDARFVKLEDGGKDVVKDIDMSKYHVVEGA